MDISTKFDVVIWSLIILGIVGELIILAIPFLCRHIKAQLFFLFIFICQIFVLYGSFMEPRMITVAYYETTMNRQGRITPETQQRFFIPKRTTKKDIGDVRIALLADTHVGPYKQADYVDRIADQLLLLQPDVVLIPGDFIYYHPENLVFLEPLSRVAKTIPVYASLGNHDYNWREQSNTQAIDSIEEAFRYSQQTIETMESYGINMLQNTDEVLTIGEQSLQIIGQHDWWATERIEASEIPDINTNPETISIMMQHNPDGAFFQDLPESLDIIVSGHTHGGQIRLPIIGPLHHLPTEIGDHVDQGWFTLRNPEQLLYVTHGIGEMGPRARLFAWPEVVVFDISTPS